MHIDGRRVGAYARSVVNDELGADDDQTRTGWLQTRRGKVEAAITALCILATAGLLVVLFRDSGGGDDASGTSAETTTAPSTVTTVSPTAEVEQAYRDFDAMLTRLASAPNPRDPELGRRATGEALTNFRRTLSDSVSHGYAVKVGPQTRLSFVSTTVKGDQATLKICDVDQSALIDAKTGAEIKAMSTVTSLATVTAIRTEGVWKISRVGTDADHRWEGIRDCGS